MANRKINTSFTYKVISSKILCVIVNPTFIT